MLYILFPINIFILSFSYLKFYLTNYILNFINIKEILSIILILLLFKTKTPTSSTNNIII